MARLPNVRLMAKTSARVTARERAREVRWRNAAATKQRARRIEQLQTEFFEAEALRDDAAQAVALHELDAGRRVAELLELGLAVDEVAALLDTDAKAVRGLKSRANVAVRTPAEARVSTARNSWMGRIGTAVGRTLSVRRSALSLQSPRLARSGGGRGWRDSVGCSVFWRR